MVQAAAVVVEVLVLWLEAMVALAASPVAAVAAAELRAGERLATAATAGAAKSGSSAI